MNGKRKYVSLYGSEICITLRYDSCSCFEYEARKEDILFFFFLTETVVKRKNMRIFHYGDFFPPLFFFFFIDENF